MSRGVLVSIALLWWLSGCSRDAGLRCEDQERYLGSVEIAPLEVPDDLDPPDESEALRVPRVTDTGEATGPDYGPCTESPPEFFEEGPPG